MDGKLLLALCIAYLCTGLARVIQELWKPKELQKIYIFNQNVGYMLFVGLCWPGDVLIEFVQKCTYHDRAGIFLCSYIAFFVIQTALAFMVMWGGCQVQDSPVWYWLAPAQAILFCKFWTAFLLVDGGHVGGWQKTTVEIFIALGITLGFIFAMMLGFGLCLYIVTRLHEPSFIPFSPIVAVLLYYGFVKLVEQRFLRAKIIYTAVIAVIMLGCIIFSNTIPMELGREAVRSGDLLFPARYVWHGFIVAVALIFFSSWKLFYLWHRKKI